MKPIHLPWPTGLTPNDKRSQSHWKTAKLTKLAKQLAWGLALQAGGRHMGWTTPVAVTITFEPWPGTYPDQDNCMGSVKAYLDGLALALGVDDKLFDLRYEFKPFRRPGQVTIQVENQP
jgi:crossover junction endodeoxyribonuclease RusA